MADLSKVKLPGNSTTYNLKDEQARTQLSNLGAAASKNVDTSIASATSVNLPTSAAVANYFSSRFGQECFIVETGAITSLPKTITDSRITPEYIALDEILDDNVDLGWVTTDGKLILYGRLPSGTTLESKKIKLHKCYGLEQDPVTITLRQQNSSNANGNYLVAEAKNLIPSVQYTWYLYSVSGGTETQVYAIGATTSYPTYSMWFQQVPRSLTDGTVYKCKIAPTLDSSNKAESGTVTFAAATLS